jgi:hypothetical protein
LLAVLSGVAWRLELEARWTWNSLAWIGGFHQVVPVSVGLFILWTSWCVGNHRPQFVLALVALALGAYWFAELILTLAFAAGPTGMAMMVFADQPSLVALTMRAAPLLWGLVPLAFHLLCRGFGVPVRWWAVALGALGFIVSWPLAVAVRPLFDHAGSSDALHALKSGFVIPFLMLSMGLPLLATKKLAPG